MFLTDVEAESRRAKRLYYWPRTWWWSEDDMSAQEKTAGHWSGGGPGGTVLAADAPDISTGGDLLGDELRTLETICAIGDAAVIALEGLLDSDGKEEEAVPYLFASAEQQSETEAGVQFILDHPASPLSDQHAAWLERNAGRLAADDPRRVPFDQLPFGMQLKARLWRHIVHAVVG